MRTQPSVYFDNALGIHALSTILKNKVKNTSIGNKENMYYFFQIMIVHANIQKNQQKLLEETFLIS